jgi:hypothetical protein
LIASCPSFRRVVGFGGDDKEDKEEDKETQRKGMIGDFQLIGVILSYF